MKNTTVDSVNIYDYKFKNEDYIIGAISLIILCIPIIIRIFLFVYSHISQKFNFKGNFFHVIIKKVFPSPQRVGDFFVQTSPF